MNMLDNVAHGNTTLNQQTKLAFFPPKHILPLPLEHILCIYFPQVCMVSVYIANCVLNSTWDIHKNNLMLDLCRLLAKQRKRAMSLRGTQFSHQKLLTTTSLV